MEITEEILFNQAVYNQMTERVTHSRHKTDHNRDGLACRVHTVRSEVAPLLDIPPEAIENQLKFASFAAYSFDGSLTAYLSTDEKLHDFSGDPSGSSYVREDGTEAVLLRYCDRSEFHLDWDNITDMSSTRDEEGNVVEEFFYREDGSVAWLFLNSYDIEDRLIRRDICDVDGSPIGLYICDYNTAGYPATEVLFDRDGLIMILLVHTSYEADPTGSWIRRVSEIIDKIDNSQTRQITWRTIAYHNGF